MGKSEQTIKIKFGEIAKRLGCTLEGDGEIEISDVATLENAQEGQLSFLSNSKYFNEAKKTKASAIIASQDCPNLSIAILRHENPYLMFAKAIELFHLQPKRKGSIHPTAWISDSAILGDGVSIGAFTYIADDTTLGDNVEIRENCVILEGSRIGSHTLVHAGCVIRERVQVGNNCIIQNNAVIGSDGFGYALADNKIWYKIIQTGVVVIEDNVEIGAGTTIDRATIGETRICRGAKIDNLVQIGHGCVIGENSLICAQVGLAGSTKIGKNVILAGQVGSAGHLKVGDGVIATGQTGIPSSVGSGKVISGSPAIDNKKWLRASAAFAKLPEIQKTVRDLENRVGRLEGLSKF